MLKIVGCFAKDISIADDSSCEDSNWDVDLTLVDESVNLSFYYNLNIEGSF